MTNLTPIPGTPLRVTVIVHAANPPHLTVNSEGLVPVRQPEVERDSSANGRGVTRGDEDPAEADVARLGCHLLAAHSEDHRNSKVDTTMTRDEGHLLGRTAGSATARITRLTGSINRVHSILGTRQIESAQWRLVSKLYSEKDRLGISGLLSLNRQEGRIRPRVTRLRNRNRRDANRSTQRRPLVAIFSIDRNAQWVEQICTERALRAPTKRIVR